MIGESILELHESNDTCENIKSYEYDEYQPITCTQIKCWTDYNNFKISIKN